MYDGDYDFNRDGKLDNNEREIMYDDLDRESNDYHVSHSSRRGSRSSTDGTSEWTQEDTFNWIVVVILLASIILGFVLAFKIGKDGDGITYIGFAMGIGFLISSFIDKGKLKKVYLILSIILSAGALFSFII